MSTVSSRRSASVGRGAWGAWGGAPAWSLSSGAFCAAGTPRPSPARNIPTRIAATPNRATNGFMAVNLLYGRAVRREPPVPDNQPAAHAARLALLPERSYGPFASGAGSGALLSRAVT